MHLNELLQNLKHHLPDITWNSTQDLAFGILTTNCAFLQAKQTKTNPKILAETLALEFTQILKDYDVTITTVGAYINLDLNSQGWSNYFDQDFQQITLNKIPETILVDYFSPNVGKKMHVGHIRSLNIGESLRRILNLQYQKVISNNHLGDWGIQFGMIIWGIQNLDTLGINPETYTSKSNFYYDIYVSVNKIIDQELTQSPFCNQKDQSPF